MKIVSNTKDYYDHVANILGVDETLRYERLPFVAKECRTVRPSIPMTTTCRSHSPWPMNTGRTPRIADSRMARSRTCGLRPRCGVWDASIRLKTLKSATDHRPLTGTCCPWGRCPSLFLGERKMSNYIDPVDQKTGLDANVPPASKRQSSIKVPMVFGKNRTRGNSVGAMIDDMYGEHAVLRDLLSREARGVGIDPSTEYVTQGVSRVLRLYEEAHDAWLNSKGDTVGHVLEVELPSGQKLLMGSRQTLYGYELSPAQERSQYDCPSP